MEEKESKGRKRNVSSTANLTKKVYGKTDISKRDVKMPRIKTEQHRES